MNSFNPDNFFKNTFEVGDHDLKKARKEVESKVNESLDFKHLKLLDREHQKNRRITSPDELARAASMLQLCDGETTDEVFRSQLQDFKKNTPSILKKLSGVVQHNVHGTFDAFDHTFNTLELLDTKGLDSSERKIVRIALVLHDVGKVLSGYDPDHPRYSAVLSTTLLQEMDLNNKEYDIVERLIMYHDVLGDMARSDGRNQLDPRLVYSIFKTEREIDLLLCISLADIGSIPGLKRHTDQVISIAELYKNIIKAQKYWINQKIHTDTKEIQRIQNSESFNDYLDGLSRGDSHFDNIDIEEEMKSSRDNYQENSTEQEKMFFEKALLVYARANNTMMFKLLQICGRDTDRSYVVYLEKKYNERFDNLRIAVELFRLTYGTWRTSRTIFLHENNDNEPTETDDNYEEYNYLDINSKEYFEIIRELKEIKKSAYHLLPYQVLATHGKSLPDIESYRDAGEIPMATTEFMLQYEGEGIYIGIMGGFDKWAHRWHAEPAYHIFRTPLAHTFPILHKYHSPEAMANILGNNLILGSANSFAPAQSSGLIHWYEGSFSKQKVPMWKISAIEEVLNCKAIVVTDEHNCECVVIDSEEEPIIWASIVRTLKINRCMPLNQVEHSKLPDKTAIWLDPKWKT